MEATARQKNIIMSPRKIRRVINTIRGKKVTDAYNILRLMPYSAAKVVLKNLIDATHNAKIKFGVEPEALQVSSIYADGGRKFVRFKPRAQGRVYKREKKTAHLTIKLTALES